GWSADEVGLRPRPLNYEDLDAQLSRQKADIIFAFFGMNEAFKGPDSLENFKRQLKDFLQNMKGREYNGEAPPEVILVSPIAQEEKGQGFPDPSEQNNNLQLYTKAMQTVAGELQISFINLYEPSKRLMGQESEPLTTNGIHLNEAGYEKMSEHMARALGLSESSWNETPYTKDLKKVIAQKNQLFFYLNRPVNGEYIYGSRNDWPGASPPFPAEFEQLGGMVQQMDSTIWTGLNSGTINTGKANSIINSNQDVQGKKDKPTDSDEPASTDQFVLQEGYQIELFASEKDFPIENPVTLTFDPQGRLWVASMPSYPQYYPGIPPNDKIVILEDTDRDGKADKHTVFADSLYLPLGFELGDGGVYVTQLPDLVFLKDTDGDGQADYKETLLQGFGTEDSHHAISAYTWGPDGALYMHGGTFLHSQIETPYGPKRGAYGTTWRYKPGKHQLDLYVSYPYANPWGNVFTREGTHLIGDVSTGMNYFASPLTTAIDYPKKHVMMEDFLTSNVLPKTSGMEIISSRQFPDSVQGNVLFNTFIGFQGITHHKVSENSNGMVVGHETEPLLHSKEATFRPVDLQFGPDGALYVIDWYNEVINHGEVAFREENRDNSHGRIWRITHKDSAALPVVDLTQLSIDELLDQLKTYEDRTRYRTRIQLREFPKAQVLPALKQWVSQLDPANSEYEHFRLEALWVHQQLNHPNETLLMELLNSPNEDVRAAATRVLFYWRDKIKNTQQILISMSKDSAPRVRLEAIVALSHYGSEATVNALLSASELPTEYYIDYALKEAFKHLKPVWVKMFEGDPHFLAGEPEKARLLLQPFYSPKELTLPGFIPQEEAPKQSYNPFSEKDIRTLSNNIAVNRFWISQKGVPDSTKKQGIRCLAKQRGQQPVDILLEEIVRLDSLENRQGLDDLLYLLSEEYMDQVQQKEEQLARLAEKGHTPQVRALGIALLNEARGSVKQTRQIAQKSAENLAAFLGSVQWTNSERIQEAMYKEIIGVLQGEMIAGYQDGKRNELQASAMHALHHVDNRVDQKVKTLTRFVQPDGKLAKLAASNLLSIPDELLTGLNLRPLKGNILKVLETAKTGGEAVPENILPLGKKVANLLPEEEGKRFLDKLVEMETTTIEIAAVPGDMRFDLEEFTVTAGKPVEIVFKNPDNMVHNMLITTPESSIEEIGKMAVNMDNGYEKNFIPKSDQVLFSTPLINTDESYTLEFTAPETSGDYPFVCTFPGHWRTMNGIMKIAE
ncbi:MAG TPA: PVC-type heme-binding CxxCH protein, partial [Fodinibius sp.]|nr:PVC-type heme-binding CxxCH protein [Fodinibius sp.]